MNSKATTTASTSSERGFTLIEIMCACTILTVSLLGLASVAGYAMNNNRGGQTRELAMGLAQQRLERMRNTSFANLTPGTVSEQATSHEMLFTIETTICASAACDASSSATQKVIFIKVTPQGTASQWAGASDANDDSKSVVVTTWRASRSLGSN